MPRVTTVRDGCVVQREPLARLVREFLDHRVPGNPSQNRALDWLAAETKRYDRTGRGVPKATIRTLIGPARATQTTELWIADLLVTAIDRTEAFHDGTLKISHTTSTASVLDYLATSGWASRRDIAAGIKDEIGGGIGAVENVRRALTKLETQGRVTSMTASGSTVWNLSGDGSRTGSG